MDETAQSGTNGNFTATLAPSNTTSSAVLPGGQLDPMQEEWISYCATQGWITDEAGNVTKMSIVEFADKVGVPRRTLYNWKEQITDFDKRVSDRRFELFGGNREGKIWNTLYVMAINPKGGSSTIEAAKLILANKKGASLRLPTQQVQAEVKHSWADMAAAKKHIIEGETADTKAIDAPTP